MGSVYNNNKVREEKNIISECRVDFLLLLVLNSQSQKGQHKSLYKRINFSSREKNVILFKEKNLGQ